MGLKCSHRQEGETHTERGRKEIKRVLLNLEEGSKPGEAPRGSQ